MLQEIQGDLFESKEKYIVHQCNCVTTRAAHLAADVFRRFPYADVYTCRDPNMQKRAVFDNENKQIQPEYYSDKPGNIIVRGNGADQRYVIAILGQFYPGRPRYSDSRLDGVKARQSYFHQGLWKIAQVEGLESVAFPRGIGCGAAGGDWSFYRKMIKKFADYLGDGVKTVIYEKY